MASRIALDPGAERGAVERRRPRRRVGSRATGRPATGGPGGTRRSGPAPARPSNGSTTAHVPRPSRAARSEVTSTRPVSSRPPTTASRRGVIDHAARIGAPRATARARFRGPTIARVHIEFTDEQEAAPQGGARLRRGRDRAARRALGPRPHVPHRRGAGAWATWACSASRSPRSTAAGAPTSPRCASPSRSSAGSTSRSPSRSRPASASAPTRSSGSAPRSSGRRGSPTCAPAGRSAGSA